MDVALIRRSIEDFGEETFSRSSGPGGQNVNKVSSKALLRMDLARLLGVTDDERARLVGKLQSRLNAEGELVLQAQDERSQLLNRELAISRMVALIAAALHREKPRRKTKPTKASQERRMAAKKVSARHKLNRQVRED